MAHPQSSLREFALPQLDAILIGLGLLAAGLAKWDAYWRPGFEPADLPLPTFLVPYIAILEAALAIWLLVGIHHREARSVASVAFAIFAVAALWTAVQGRTSCGCLGDWNVNPWWMFTYDVLACIVLQCLPRVLAPVGIQSN